MRVILPDGPEPPTRPATETSAPRQPRHYRRERLHGALRDVDVADAELTAALLELVADLRHRADQRMRMRGQHLLRDIEPTRHRGHRLAGIVADRDEVGRDLQLDVAEPVR